MGETDFEWDEANIIKIVSSGRGITPELCFELAENDPRFFPEERPSKSGDFWMIAPDDRGRFWTIVVVSKGPDRWRPITGWPSTNSQIRRYRDEE